MSSSDLNRLRDDLEAVRRAAGLEPVFGPDDVTLSLVLAGCGALLTAWAVLGTGPYHWLVLVPLAVPALLAVRLSRKAYRRRAQHPGLWREHRVGLRAAAVLVPLLIAYIQWEKRLGMPREFAGAASVFFTGAGLLLVALVSRARLHYAGGALPLMAFGLAVPLCPARQVAVAGGLCMTATGLLTAALQAWQLRTGRVAHVAD